MAPSTTSCPVWHAARRATRTLFIANILILFLTTSMPLASLAFSSRTPALYPFSPRSCLARACTEEVLPVPGGPQRIKLGMLPSTAMAESLVVVSLLPTTCSSVFGRYFSTQGCSKDTPFFALDKDDIAGAKKHTAKGRSARALATN